MALACQTCVPKVLTPEDADNYVKVDKLSVSPGSTTIQQSHSSSLDSGICESRNGIDLCKEEEYDHDPQENAELEGSPDTASEKTMTLKEAIVPPKGSSSLLVQITETDIKAVLLRNGEAEPIPLENDSFSKPLWIALVNTKLFMYGSEAKTWVETKIKSRGCFPDTSRYWNLGELLKLRRRMRREYIMFDNQIQLVSIEFLLALYLRHLKDTVLQRSVRNEASENMGSIIFVIPLWLGSTQRQHIKDAGIISGFEHVFLMNEACAIALFSVATSDQQTPNHRHHREKRSPSTESKRMLVLVENSGNVDIATYKFFCDPKGTKILEMITCSGNLYESPRTRHGVASNLMKICYKSDQNFDDPKFKVFMKSLASNLVGDALNSHPEGQGGNSFDVLICTQDRRWLPIFLYAVNTWFVNVPPIIMHQNKETPLACFGNVFSDNTSVRIISQLVPDKICDLTPYTFYRRDFELEQFKDSLLEKNAKLEGDIQVMEKIRIPKASTQLVLFQRNVLHEEMLIGTLEINMVAYYKYSEIETSFFVDDNGVMTFDKLYGISFAGRQQEVIPSTYYIWRGSNLLELEVFNLKDRLCCFVNSFPEIERKVMETKQNVIDKCEKMKGMMDEGKSKKMSSATKKLIRTRIKNGLKLKEVSTILELVEADSDIILSNINDDYEKYF